MKGILMLCFLTACLQSHAQLFKRHATHLQPALIASNGKTTRRYNYGRALKIHFHDNGQITKAKGRLMFDGADSIELIPYGKKNIALIDVDSITSISHWNRKGKSTLLVLTAIGGAAGALGVITLLPNNGESADGLNPIAFLLILSAATDLYYVSIAAPVVFISEWLSVRSEKRGYHFSIE